MRNKECFWRQAVVAVLLPCFVFSTLYAQADGLVQPSQAQQVQVQEEPKKPLPQDHVLAVVEGLDKDLRDLLVMDYLKLFVIASSIPEETRAKLAGASVILKKTIESAELTHKTETKRMESERELAQAELERLTMSPVPTAATVLSDRKRLEEEVAKRKGALENTKRDLAEVEKKLATENREKERTKLLENQQKLSATRVGLENELAVLEEQIGSLRVSAPSEWQAQKKEKQHRLRCRIEALDVAVGEVGVTYEKKKLAYYHADAKLDLLINWSADERRYLDAIAAGTISTLLQFSDVENIGFRTLHGKGWKSDEKAQQKSLKKGKEIYEEMKKRNLIKDPIDDPEVQNYVQDIRDLLVQNSDIKPGSEIKVVVVNDDEVNAFAIPGYFFVNKGFLLAIEKESQLVAVMAHELSHISALHIDRFNKRANKRGWFYEALRIGLYLAAVITQQYWLLYVMQYGLPFAGILLIANLLGISRDFEAEADILGAQYTWKAGYDPRAFTEVFDLFSRLSKRDPRAQGWFVTHPSDYNRMRSGYTEWLYLNSIDPKKELKTDSPKFHEVQDRLRTWNEEFKKKHPEEYRPTLKRKGPKEEGCPGAPAPESTTAPAPLTPTKPTESTEPQTTTPETPELTSCVLRPAAYRAGFFLHKIFIICPRIPRGLDIRLSTSAQARWKTSVEAPRG